MSDAATTTPTTQGPDPDDESLERERYELLTRLERSLETPMLVLAFVWLALLVLELTHGASPAFEVIGTVIWAIFILNFALELVLAPRKGAYLKSNWLTAISLVIPALRLVRVFRVFRLLQVSRVGRSVRLFRFVSSMNRGMRALGASLRRRGFGYVLGLTLIVVFVGAAGMYALERDAPGGGFDGYAGALWWTAMIVTTMGSEYWPRTPDGRVLCFFLALYSFTVFGYVTATLATFFIGRDAATGDTALRAENEALRTELARLRG